MAKRTFYSVHEAAGLARVSERTIWSHIARGLLFANRRRNGTVRISQTALQRYLGGSRFDGLLTLKELRAAFWRRSVRSLRRDIQSGRLPVVRVGARRIYIREADALRVYADNWHLDRDALKARKRAGTVGEVLQPDRSEPQEYCSPKELAIRSGQPLRTVYYDIREGVIEAKDVKGHRRRRAITSSGARTYVEMCRRGKN